MGTAEGNRRNAKARAEDQVDILISEVTVESSYLRTKRSKLRSQVEYRPVYIHILKLFEILDRG